MAPAFGHDRALRLGEDAGGPGETVRDALEGPAGRTAPDRAGAALFHQVGDPARGRVARGAVGEPERSVGGEGERGDAGDAVGERRVGARLAQPAVVGRDGEAAVGGDREGGDLGGERGEERAVEGEDAGAGGADHAAVEKGEVVGGGEAREHRGVVEGGVRPQRAVERRDGDRLAAEEVEDGVEDHGRRQGSGVAVPPRPCARTACACLPPGQAHPAVRPGGTVGRIAATLAGWSARPGCAGRRQARAVLIAAGVVQEGRAGDHRRPQ